MQIKDEFKKLIPALSVEEFNQLEQNCLAEGIREKIITWNGFIIDGHNRFEIATKHKLKFETESKQFNSEDDVKIWMIDNQEGRRNLTDGWKYKLKNTKKEILFKKGEAKRIETKIGNNNASKTKLSIIDNVVLPKHNTQKIIANELGWSTGKTAMADVVFKKATPELEEKVLSNEITINQAYKEIKKEENKTKVINLELQEVQTKSHTAILHNVDCLNYLKNLDVEIDLLITDPPYFTDGDFTSHVLNYLNKVKKTGQAYVFASADPQEVLSYIKLQPINLQLEQILIWNYNNGGQLQPKTRYNSNYQICFYYRGIDAPQINKPTDGKHQYACQTINAPDGRIGDRYHKWQKPNELIERLIKNSSNIDDFIFDPFAGTSTTLVSAVKLGRRAEGCEVDIEAVKISNKRGVQNGI
jgi:DNA modification methylase